MSLLKKLLHNAQQSQPADDGGGVSAERVIELINEKASSFRGGQGMVLVVQLSWRVRVYFVNGIPKCSWQFANDELCLDRVGATLAEGNLAFELQPGSFASLQKKLKSYFRNRDLKVTPLSQYEDETWAMRISFE